MKWWAAVELHHVRTG